MPASIWQIGRVRDFRGGETQAALPEEIGGNQIIRMENAMIYPDGRLAAAHQADTPVVTGVGMGLCIVPQANGTYTAYSASGNGYVYRQFLDTGSNNAVDMEAGVQNYVEGAIISGVSKAVRFLGKDYCPSPNAGVLNGILNLSDFSLISVPANGSSSKLKLYVNRLWLLHSDGVLQFSDNGDAALWDALNVVLLPNSEPVVDFYPVPGGAIVYSRTAIYAMYGSTYADLSFIPLLSSTEENPKNFTTGSVLIDGVVYILAADGVHAASLNGVQVIPHHQERYFQSCYRIFSDPSKTISAVYLQRFKAILFTWPEVYGVGQSLVFYLSGAYSKLNRLLPTGYPYIIGMNDGNTDYIIGLSTGVLAKSAYPSANMTDPQPSILQTSHGDVGSAREKVWSCLTVVTDEVVYGFTLQAVLDEMTTIDVVEGVGLTAGENVFWLDDVPRSKTLSFIITIDNGQAIEICTDEDPTMLITDDDGNILVAGYNPGNWTLKELRLRYREAGPYL